MRALTQRGETDESLVRDARERAAVVLAALRRDAVSLAGDPQWAEGQRLYAEACNAAEQLLDELNVNPKAAAAVVSPRDSTAKPPETPRS